MGADVLLGLQWGDEGKGKIVDVLAPKYDVVARFQGGPNAGHTLEFDGIQHVLHTIPSGIFHEDTMNIIGNGVVIDPVILKKEIDEKHREEIERLNSLKETWSRHQDFVKAVCLIKVNATEVKLTMRKNVSF